MKKKWVSIFFSVATLAMSITTIPNVFAEVVEEVKENHPPSQDLDARISEFEVFLNEKIKMGATFNIDEIEKICSGVTKIIKNESHLLKVEGDTIIVGDTHSDMGAIDYCCREFLSEVKNGKSIIFLGDYVDRGANAPGGPNGIKNVMLLFKLKTLFPDKVVLLRGNHEDRIMNMNMIMDVMTGKKVPQNGTFYKECSNKYMFVLPESQIEKICNTINNVFDYLSLAAIVNNRICMHGGLHSELTSIQQISELNKPLSSESCRKNPMINGILWDDPCLSIGFYTENWQRGGNSQLFGKRAVVKFLKTNGLIGIIRAHQCVAEGHEERLNGMLITLFSAPKYDNDNKAEIIKLEKSDSGNYSVNYKEIILTPKILGEYSMVTTV